jgi:hypothetical protein
MHILPITMSFGKVYAHFTYYYELWEGLCTFYQLLGALGRFMHFLPITMSFGKVYALFIITARFLMGPKGGS